MTADVIARGMAAGATRLTNAKATRMVADLGVFDDFQRPDTLNGTLGSPVVGGAYDIRGDGGTAASVGRLSNGLLVTNEGSTGYWIQTLTGLTNKVGFRFGWTVGTGSGESTHSLAIVPSNASGSALYANAGLHVAITRTTWVIQYILATSFVSVANGTFATPLSLDTTYQAEFQIDGQVVHYNIAGLNGRAISAGIPNGGLSRYVFWEHFYNGGTAKADKPYTAALWAGPAPAGDTLLRERVVAHWKFQTTAWLDSSGLDHTLTGFAVPTVAAGKIGNGVTLIRATSQYLQIADHPDFDLGSKDWAISAWFNPVAVNDGNYYFILSKGLEYAVYLSNTGKAIAYASTDGTFPNGTSAASTGTATAGVWNHVMARYSASAGILFVSLNGETEVGATLASVFSGTGAVQVGRSSGFEGIGVTPTYFNGMLDEISVFSSPPGHAGALSPRDRTAIYNGGEALAFPW